jgi:hypothetical protein
MSRTEYPFFAKDTYGLNYYKVNSPFEGIKIGKFNIEMQFQELERLVRWNQSKNDVADFREFIPIDKDVFREHHTIVQDEINRIISFKW